MSNRRFVQFATMPGERPALIALDDAGTLWQAPFPHGKWERIKSPEVQQQEEKEASIRRAQAEFNYKIKQAELSRIRAGAPTTGGTDG